MIIGNMKFEIEKHRKYTPEELADIILEEPYGDLFADVLIRNNSRNWLYLPVPCTFEERDGKIYLHYLPDPEGDPDDRDMFEEIVSVGPVADATDKLKRALKKMQRTDGIWVTVISHNGAGTLVVYFDDEEDEERDLLIRFLNDVGIDDALSLRKAANEAKDSFCKSVEDEEADPFVW